MRGQKPKSNEWFLESIKDKPLIALENYVNAKTKIKFKCLVCEFEWMTKPNSIQQGSGCYECTRKRVADSKRGVNEIIENHGSWLLIDISTPKRPDVRMAVDSDIFNNHNGGKIYASDYSKCNYIHAKFNMKSRSKLFHHSVMEKKSGFEIDHIKHGDMNYIDNRRSNLRYATRSQNVMNNAIRRNNTSGTTGVSLNKKNGRWRAYIRVNYKDIHLGEFNNIEIAIGVRQQAEREFFGEYAYNYSN